MKFLKTQSIWMGVAVVLFVAGCKGSGDDTTASQTPPANPPASTPNAGGAAGTPSSTGGTKFSDVQAVLTANCAGCHGGAHPKAGVDLTSYASIMKGGMSGPIVVAGDADNSLIIKAVNGAAGVKKMPPRGALDAASIQTLTGWIKAGAKNE